MQHYVLSLFVLLLLPLAKKHINLFKKLILLQAAKWLAAIPFKKSALFPTRD